MDIQQVKDIKLNFILATARTGSTLLVSLLNMHPNVISTSEEPFAYNLYPKYKNVKNWTSDTIQSFCYDFYLFSEGMLELQFGTKKDLEGLLEANKSNLTVEIAIKIAYLCFFPNKDKSKITTVVDKQLKFHFCLKKIAAFYPQSKFIILYRDPRDQALVRFKMLKKLNAPKGYYQISTSWKYIYTRLLSLKNKIGDNRFLEVKYEDLVSNPETELKKICQFLDITYDAIMLNFHESIKKELNQNKDKLSDVVQSRVSLLHEGLTQKVNTDKIDIWKQDLKKEEADLIWTICSNPAERIGYKPGENFIKQNKKIKDYLIYLSILLTRTVTFLYYSSPFFIKRLIKKIKYGKKFKSTGYASELFYKKTYHAN